MKTDRTEVVSNDILDEVLTGLNNPQKSLPSKLFYDERGSELFDRICELKEYYPTRTEMGILTRYIDEISDCIGRNNLLIELGSGSSTKIRLLLDHNPNLSAYIPIDISEDFLYKSAEMLQEDYPELMILPHCADYTLPVEIPDPGVDFHKNVVFYPGSTIGNFTKNEAKKFIERIHNICGPDGNLLIGVDLKKDMEVLEAAYNDSEGVTAAFNLNILEHINRKFDADFYTDKFTHKAFFDKNRGRIEMHLVSLENQTVTIQGDSFYFKKGETIHTENSYKYTLDEFETLSSEFFIVEKVWTDPDNYFSVQFLKAR